jgi:uncharacterized iron-regulated membrane protein
MGLLFGLPNQLALLALSAGLSAMIIWGYVMWWKRRPTRGGIWALGRPPARGAFLRAHWAGVTATVTVMVALGLFLPLLGWSLLAFLVLDYVVAEIKGRRTRVPVSQSQYQEIHRPNGVRAPSVLRPVNLLPSRPRALRCPPRLARSAGGG